MIAICIILKKHMKFDKIEVAQNVLTTGLRKTPLENLYSKEGMHYGDTNPNGRWYFMYRLNVHTNVDRPRRETQ